MRKILVILFFFFSCGSVLAQRNVHYDIEPGIERIQDDYVNNWRKISTIDGYRIQIAAYSGVNSRSQAEGAKNAFSIMFPYIKANVIYTEPYFKVRVGNYRTRLQAYKDLEDIRLSYPSAYIVPDKITYR